ncbi:MAG: ribonuclease [Burkholderiales bacterium]|nr:ribonuclease [Burkholderiales bacterium]
MNVSIRCGAVLRLFLAACAAWFLAGAAHGYAVGEVEAAALPREARGVLAAIRKGGPFAYAKDGTVFGNREGILPRKARGYYREYTVETPGARNRGARRLVCGGEARDWERNAPAACYYTDDHYASFRRIRE